MTHVVALALHGLRINFGEAVAARIRAQDLFGQRGCLRVLWNILFLFFGLWLDKHLPQSLGLQSLETLIGGRITPDVGHSLSELLDSDRECVGLVVIDHGLERITVKSMLGIVQYTIW